MRDKWRPILGPEDSINRLVFFRGTLYLLLRIKSIFEYLHEYQASNVEFNATV
jgi:hypothetical protein